MKALKLTGWAVALAVGSWVSSVQAGGILCAVDDVLNNSKETSITWKEQTYTIKPPEMVEKTKDSYTLNGTLQHRNGSANKHDLAYRITKEKGAVKKIEIQTDGGMWLPMSAEMTRAMGDLCKSGPVDDKKRNDCFSAMQRVADNGSWQKMAELIIAYVGVRHC
jgi:hypothetical protein